MLIEFRCQNCHQRLRVDIQRPGQRARCPSCQSVVAVPTNRLQDSDIELTRAKADVIDYELFGHDLQYVEVTLDAGEVAVARPRSVIYYTPGIAMVEVTERPTSTGFFEKLTQTGRRLLAGGEREMMGFCNVSDHREIVAFAPVGFGRLVPLHLDELGGQLLCQRRAIVCAARGIEMRTEEQTELLPNLRLQRVHGDGVIILQVHGAMAYRRISEQKSLLVKAEYVVAMTPNMQCETQDTTWNGDPSEFLAMHGPGELWLGAGRQAELDPMGN